MNIIVCKEPWNLIWLEHDSFYLKLKTEVPVFILIY